MTETPDEKTIACSLRGRELKRRLEEISALAGESLLDQESDGERQVLRFRADRETRDRLEALVAAEAECCPFLELSLEAAGSAIVLTARTP